MDTLEHRLSRVRTRTQALQARRLRIRITQLLLLGALLLGSVLYVIGRQSQLHHPSGGASATASSLLASSAGGYVLVAVLAFSLGVVIVCLCRYWQAKRRNDENRQDGGEDDE